MLRQASYVVPLEPCAWKRPAVTKGRYYDQQAQYKVTYGIYLSSQHDGPLFDKPIDITVTFHIKRPKNCKFKKNLYCPNVPDIDNLLKLLLDTARGVLYADDRIVSSVTARKIYCTDDNPRTQFIITELE